MGEPSSARPPVCLVAPLLERSGRETPVSVDSIPLEWDHDYDLSRGLESASRTLDSAQDHSADEGDFLQGGAVGLTGELLLGIYRHVHSVRQKIYLKH